MTPSCPTSLNPMGESSVLMLYTATLTVVVSGVFAVQPSLIVKELVNSGGLTTEILTSSVVPAAANPDSISLIAEAKRSML